MPQEYRIPPSLFFSSLIHWGLCDFNSSLGNVFAYVAKAFRGELIPQNPKDEPATELLTEANCRGKRENGSRQESHATRQAED